MNLHKENNTFKDAIIATAQALGVREVYIEKDYWVTYALKSLAYSEYKDVAIFKGGTSLSKALNLIERFSEDIDLALVIPEGASGNQVKTLITRIQKTTAGEIPEIEIKGITSKGSKFRKTVHQYPRLIKQTNYGQASDKLLIEVNAFATPTPYALQKIQSYIGEYLLKKNQIDLVTQYELEAFEVNVLQLERTFTEKILGLIRSSSHENPIQELKNKIRHIYDLERILQKDKISTFLASPTFFNKINEVKKDDAGNHEFAGDWINQPLLSSILFSEVEKTWDKLESTYFREFKSLVYGYLPSSEEIMKSLKNIAKQIEVYDNYGN